MMYRVTFVQNSDYCKLNPSDKDCLFSVDLEAPTKAEAAYKYHRNTGMVFDPIAKSTLPVVWGIKEL